MLRIPALLDKSSTAQGGPITRQGGNVFNNCGATLLQTDVGIVSPIVVSGTGESDGAYAFGGHYDPTGTLTSIVVSGPATVASEGTAQYTCTGHYSSGGTQDLTDVVTWADNSPNASIDSSGLLTAGVIGVDEDINVTADYQTFSDSLPVTLQAAVVSTTDFVTTWEITGATTDIALVSNSTANDGHIIWETLDGTTTLYDEDFVSTGLNGPWSLPVGEYRLKLSGLIKLMRFTPGSELKTCENMGHVGATGYSSMYEDQLGMTSFKAGNVDASLVISMSRMMRDTPLLDTVDLTGFENLPVCLDLQQLFRNCPSLTEVSIAPVDLSVVENYVNFLLTTTLTSASYNQMWADIKTKYDSGEALPSQSFYGGGSVATETGSADSGLQARNYMINTGLWIVTDATP